MNSVRGASGSALSTWTMGSKTEPTIRVGIVLPADDMQSVRARLPDASYTSQADGRSRSLAAGEIQINASQGRVMLEGADASAVEQLRIVPLSTPPLERGSGLQLFDIIAGRGFHWQTRISPTFAGWFEFRAIGPHLLVINELPMETYLAGVIAAEMSGACPLEFLRSQCIVARAWVLAHTEDKHSEIGVDRCNDDCCQRYQGTHDITPTVIEAVQTTRGQVITDGRGRIIDANYSKSCGGIIEAPEHVWNVRKPGQRSAVDAPADSPSRRFFPLREDQLSEFLTGEWMSTTDIFCSPAVVPDMDLPRYLGKVDDGGGHFRWRIRYAREELEAILRRKLFAKQPADPLGTLTDLAVVARGESGRAKQLRIAYLDRSGRPRQMDVHTEYNIRDALHNTFLFSSAFLVQIDGDAAGIPQTIELIGAGWGHGAGLCQIGALGMSLRNYSAEQILHHYFSPISIETLY